MLYKGGIIYLYIIHFGSKLYRLGFFVTNNRMDYNDGRCLRYGLILSFLQIILFPVAKLS